MPRFFVRKDQICDDTVRIVGDDAHHIARSLRMAAGEHITVCDMQRTAYDCVLERFDGDAAVYARILSSCAMDTEPPFEARLFQALPKGDKLDTVIQKAVECGVSEIIPFESERCIVRVKREQEEKKTERRCRIAAEAAKQCGRGCLPPVLPTLSFDEAIRQAATADIPIFCYEGDDTESLKLLLSEHRAKLETKTEIPTVSVVIGSEGGFSLEEASRAREAGFLMAGLGKRILRTETASAFVLGCLVYEFEL